jgi:CubicO group peptidase (beta-lactamase class C family)
MSTILLLVALVMTACSSPASQPPTSTPMPSEMVLDPDMIARIDEWLNQTSKDGTFSGSVLIAEKGQVLLSQGYGWANRMQKTPNTPQTRFRLASISKQFTAVAILILQSQGKLSVQDPICNYIADCYAAWEDITIHHLLTHTSGLSKLLWPFLKAEASTPVTPSHPVQTISFFRDFLLESQPGDQFAYSNAGYVLLAYIIEKVSGQSYEAFLQQVIFTPLDMPNTAYEHSTSALAAGYANRFVMAPEPYVGLSIPDGSGDLYSTVEDLYLWDQALYTELLLPRAQLDRMFAPLIQETNMPSYAYGYGWYIGEDRGRSVVGHGGNTVGFATLIVRYPNDQITMIMLMNQQDVNQLAVWEFISNEIFGDK